MVTLSLLLVLMALDEILAERSFTIDYDNDRFLKDGQPYRYISGSMHYFRVPSFYWQDRLDKMKAAGLNAIEFYIPWNVHEPKQGDFVFSGDADLLKFVTMCQRTGLDVIMRMGPYTCGEFENGGFPWWLLKIENPPVRMRTSDERFLYHVSKWFFKLMPMLQPFLYKNGGPIIMMQVENEYGSRSYCDRNYTTYLRDLFRSYVGDDFVLFTVDGAGVGYLKCGFIPGVYPTVDFGTGSKEGVANAFAAQRAYAPKGPLVNTEFYPGWLDIWGYNHSVAPTEPIVSTMRFMYDIGASFNFYMFEGGTNFGYMNGESGGNEPITTSYDYDAPMSEAGDPTPKYYAIRDAIANLTGRTLPPVPPATPKANYGAVPTQMLGEVTVLLDALAPEDTRLRSFYPKTFEQIDFPYGFVLYETELPSAVGNNLSVPGINDRGYVMIDGVVQGMVKKLGGKSWMPLVAEKSSKLQILVENNGRQCSGFNDPKGIVGNVLADNVVLTNWIIYPLSIENIFDQLKSADKRHALKRKVKTALKSRQSLSLRNYDDAASKKFAPSIYYTKFSAEGNLSDTFFNPQNWSKGQMFINEFNVGRYWPSLGPQVTLYVPKNMLVNLNYVVILELEYPGNCRENDNFTCYVSFINKPTIDKPVVSKTKSLKMYDKLIYTKNELI